MGRTATYIRQCSALVGEPMASQDEGVNFTMFSEVESLNRGSGLPLAYAYGLSPPTSVGRESAANDVSRLSTCADLQTQYVETHTNVTDLTMTNSRHRAYLKPQGLTSLTKVWHTDLKVDSAEQSTYLQQEVTSLSPLRPTERQMAPHRTADKGPQTLF